MFYKCSSSISKLVTDVTVPLIEALAGALKRVDNKGVLTCVVRSCHYKNTHDIHVQNNIQLHEFHI